MALKEGQVLRFKPDGTDWEIVEVSAGIASLRKLDGSPGIHYTTMIAAPTILWESVSVCPKCEIHRALSDDYLCWECRYET